MRTARWLLCAWILGGLPAWAAPDKTEASLLLPVEVTPPGQTILAGVRMEMAEGWHTYWTNPGEAGMATEIDWSLPEGIRAGDIQWPVPEKYTWSSLINYVYHDEVILLVPLEISPELEPGTVTLGGTVEWLECKEQCIPGQGEISAQLIIGEETRPSADQQRLAAAKEALPDEEPPPSAKAWWAGDAGEDGTRPLVLTWKPSSEADTYDFFPYAADDHLVAPATETLPDATGRAVIRKRVESFDGQWPQQAAGLLVEQKEGGEVVAAHSVSLKISPSAEAAAGEGGAAVPRAEAGGEPPVVPGAEVSLLGILGLAFLGGLILNIMPCVLPVIALKVLGFVNQSKEEPGRVRFLGVVYALGVVASFLVLAGLIIGVKAAGQTASWGMQFGNPYFLVAITLLVLLVALNLFGLFEVHLGGKVMGAAGTLASKEGATGAFFNGVLATALATPCTAPFLSVALGFAIAQPASIIILTFVTVALGLAAPYLVLSWNPAWLKFVPKPGAWMERFKVAMGFPMLATAIWLFSILERHYGRQGILWVGLFMVTVALAAWVYGEFVQQGGRRRGLALAVSLVLVAVGYGVTMEGQLDWRNQTPLQASAGGDSLRTSPEGIAWKAWSPAAVEAARREGHPVLVDFTADWCLTCKVNMKTSLEVEAVRRKIEETGTVPLLADNTLIREDIARELQKHGRAGVPLVLVYPRDTSKPPEVLPTVLTPNLVLEALDKAAQPREAAQISETTP